MAAPNTYWARLSRYAARHSRHNWLPLSGGQPVVSITFDDILASAAHTGARILEQRNCRGTFYIAGGLTGGTEEGRATHTLQDMQDLHARGHEIGSHGWAHIPYAETSAAGILADQNDNLTFLRSHLDAHAGENFAYPFGQYDWRAKHLTTRVHQSCRVLDNGLHRHRADLNLLGCERLYGAGRQPETWQSLLEALQPNDWLIVNTHEVEAHCGPYGCTPADLEAFVDMAQRHRCLVLPIRDAIRHYRSQR